MDNLVEKIPHEGELLSTDAVRLAAGITGGPRRWFLWYAGSGQDLLPFPADQGLELVPTSVSQPGRSIELDARLFEQTTERWHETPNATVPQQRRTPLGRRLDEIRARIKASDQPLLSWEDIDRELAERRGE